MRVVVLLNPRSGTAPEEGHVRETYRRLGAECEILPLGGPDGGEERLAVAARGCDVLVAAGGDGTIGAAASVLVSSGSGAALGVMPFGTCNDFGRGLGVACDLEESAEVVVRGRSALLDLIRLDDGSLCINQANGGFSGEVADDVEEEKESLPGPLAYLKASAEALREKPEYELTLAVDGERLALRALNLTVANARFSGGGIPTAPGADPSDGLMDIVILEARSRLGLLALLPRIRAGEHLEEDGVIHRRAKRLELFARPDMPFSVDGETRAAHPRSFEILPGRLRVRVPA